MKRDMESLNLQNAFAPEPESCRQALMNAACSVKEDEPVKKYTLRTVLIAAVVIATMMAVAIAATSGGLADWFQTHYHATLPQSAQEILVSTEKSVLEAGPVAFIVNELLCDGKIAYLTVEAQLEQEGSAILHPDYADVYDRIGEVMAKTLKHPDINAQTTYVEAARLTGLPLYTVSAWLEMDNYNLVECEMLDGAALENGHQMLVRMMYFNEIYAGEALPAQVQVRVREIDLNTLEYQPQQDWAAEEERVIPIHGVTDEKHYEPEQSAVLSGRFTLTGVTARQTSAGVYVFIEALPHSPATLEELFEMNFEWDVLDAQGNSYPTGLSLTAELLDVHGNQLPTEVPMGEVELGAFQYMLMIAADELPEAMIVTDGILQIPVQ